MKYERIFFTFGNLFSSGSPRQHSSYPQEFDAENTKSFWNFNNIELNFDRETLRFIGWKLLIRLVKIALNESKRIFGKFLKFFLKMSSRNLSRMTRDIWRKWFGLFVKLHSTCFLKLFEATHNFEELINRITLLQISEKFSKLLQKKFLRVAEIKLNEIKFNFCRQKVFSGEKSIG